eukprot:364673-Chlamydomonas_euryale.AAC.7
MAAYAAVGYRQHPPCTAHVHSYVPAGFVTASCLQPTPPLPATCHRRTHAGIPPALSPLPLTHVSTVLEVAELKCETVSGTHRAW